MDKYYQYLIGKHRTRSAIKMRPGSHSSYAYRTNRTVIDIKFTKTGSGNSTTRVINNFSDDYRYYNTKSFTLKNYCSHDSDEINPLLALPFLTHPSTKEANDIQFALGMNLGISMSGLGTRSKTINDTEIKASPFKMNDVRIDPDDICVSRIASEDNPRILTTTLMNYIDVIYKMKDTGDQKKTIEFLQKNNLHSALLFSMDYLLTLLSVNLSNLIFQSIPHHGEPISISPDQMISNTYCTEASAVGQLGLMFLYNYDLFHNNPYFSSVPKHEERIKAGLLPCSLQEILTLGNLNDENGCSDILDTLNNLPWVDSSLHRTEFDKYMIHQTLSELIYIHRGLDDKYFDELKVGMTCIKSYFTSKARKKSYVSRFLTSLGLDTEFFKEFERMSNLTPTKLQEEIINTDKEFTKGAITYFTDNQLGSDEESSTATYTKYVLGENFELSTHFTHVDYDNGNSYKQNIAKIKNENERMLAFQTEFIRNSVAKSTTTTDIDEEEESQNSNRHERILKNRRKSFERRYAKLLQIYPSVRNIVDVTFSANRKYINIRVAKHHIDKFGYTDRQKLSKNTLTTEDGKYVQLMFLTGELYYHAYHHGYQTILSYLEWIGRNLHIDLHYDTQFPKDDKIIMKKLKREWLPISREYKGRPTKEVLVKTIKDTIRNGIPVYMDTIRWEPPCTSGTPENEVRVLDAYIDRSTELNPIGRVIVSGMSKTGNILQFVLTKYCEDDMIKEDMSYSKKIPNIAAYTKSFGYEWDEDSDANSNYRGSYVPEKIVNSPIHHSRVLSQFIGSQSNTHFLKSNDSTSIVPTISLFINPQNKQASFRQLLTEYRDMCNRSYSATDLGFCSDIYTKDRSLLDNGSQTELVDNDISNEFEETYEYYREKLENYPTLWESQKEDIAKMLIKQRVVLGSKMGSGKTRQQIIAAIVSGKKNALFVTKKGFIKQFIEEFDKLGIERPIHMESYRDFKEGHNHIIAYETLGAPITSPIKAIEDYGNRNGLGEMIEIYEAKRRIQNVALSKKKEEEAKYLKLLNKYIEQYGATAVQWVLVNFNEMEKKLRKVTHAQMLRNKFNFISYDEAHTMLLSTTNKDFVAIDTLRTKTKILSSGTIIVKAPSDLKKVHTYALRHSYSKQFGNIRRDKGWHLIDTEDLTSIYYGHIELPIVDATHYQQFKEYVTKSNDRNILRETKFFSELDNIEVMLNGNMLKDYLQGILYRRTKNKHRDESNNLQDRLYLYYLNSTYRHIYAIRNMLSLRRIPNEESLKSKIPTDYKKQTVWVNTDIDHRAEYVNTLNQYMSEIKQNTSDTNEQKIKNILHNLTKVSFNPEGESVPKKWRVINKIARENVENDNKVILFFESNTNGKLLHDYIKRHTQIHTFNTIGKSPYQRSQIISDFKKSSKSGLLFITTRSGSHAYDIPEANVIILCESPWKYYIKEQAIHRILRPGQNKDVVIYDIINRGMIDEHIYKVVENNKVSSTNLLDRSKNKLFKVSTYIQISESLMQDYEQKTTEIQSLEFDLNEKTKGLDTVIEETTVKIESVNTVRKETLDVQFQ